MKPLQSVVIIGGGIAAASIASALAAAGIVSRVLTTDIGDGASGNIAAVQMPHLMADDSPQSRLSIKAYIMARKLARLHGANLSDKAVAYGWNEREIIRQNKIKTMGYSPDFMQFCNAQELDEMVGIDTGLAGVVLSHGGAIDPRVWVQSLLDGIDVRKGITVGEINRDGETGYWRLATNQGDMLAETVIIAAGAGTMPFAKGWLDPILALQLTAGRISHLPADSLPELTMALSFGGTLARASDGRLALGAAFDRTVQLGDNLAVTAAHHLANRALLPQGIRDRLNGDTSHWQGRGSFRLSTKDRAPIVGKVDDGLYLFTALGARGMVLAPLLADYLASLMTNMPSPLDDDMAALVSPYRFNRRLGL